MCVGLLFKLHGCASLFSLAPKGGRGGDLYCHRTFERVPFLNCGKDLGQLDSCGQIVPCSGYDDYLFGGSCVSVW